MDPRPPCRSLQWRAAERRLARIFALDFSLETDKPLLGGAEMTGLWQRQQCGYE